MKRQRRQTKTNKRRFAFTLIELLMAIMLMLIVMLLVAQMFRSAETMYRTAAQRADVYSQARIALDVIEADMQRMVTDLSTNAVVADFYALNQSPGHEKDVTDIEVYGEYWDDSEFKRVPDNAQIFNLPIFLSFFTTTSWYNEVDQKYESGLAQVNYYLKKRPPIQLDSGEYEPTSAYLIRRILPSRRETAKQRAQRRGELRSFEEEVCSSVLGVQVWVANNVGAAFMAQTGKRVEYFTLCEHESDSPTGMAKLVREAAVTTNPRPANAGGGKLVFYGATPGETYSFGAAAGGNSRHIESPRKAMPLAVTIEITFVNDLFDASQDGAWLGSVRTLSRTVAVPSSIVSATLTSDDITEIEPYAAD